MSFQYEYLLSDILSPVLIFYNKIEFNFFKNSNSYGGRQVSKPHCPCQRLLLYYQNRPQNLLQGDKYGISYHTISTNVIIQQISRISMLIELYILY